MIKCKLCEDDFQTYNKEIGWVCLTCSTIINKFLKLTERDMTSLYSGEYKEFIKQYNIALKR